jgi:hypothetical protein
MPQRAPLLCQKRCAFLTSRGSSTVSRCLSIACGLYWIDRKVSIGCSVSNRSISDSVSLTCRASIPPMGTVGQPAPQRAQRGGTRSVTLPTGGEQAAIEQAALFSGGMNETIKARNHAAPRWLQCRCFFRKRPWPSGFVLSQIQAGNPVPRLRPKKWRSVGRLQSRG